MDTTSVMLSPRQIYAISPEVRNGTRDSLTPRCVVSNPKTVSTKVVIKEVLRGGSFVGSMQLLNDGIVIPDAYATYLKTLRQGEEPRIMVVAKDSHALQLVLLLINNNEEVDSV